MKLGRQKGGGNSGLTNLPVEERKKKPQIRSNYIMLHLYPVFHFCFFFYNLLYIHSYIYVYIYIVVSNGKSSSEILHELNSKSNNDFPLLPTP